ncbi:MAG: DNA translocase FtsK 4TM domain-containing protein, partial [Burkholderiales bacterium]
AVLLFALAAVLAGMLFTYSPADSCWFKTSDTLEVHNKFGSIGSYIADIIFSVFGLSGWWLVAGVFYLGYRKITRRQIHTGNWYSIVQIITFILLMASSSIFEYLSLYYTPNSTLHNGYGGMLGRFLFPQVAQYIGQFSTALLTLGFIIICFSLTFSLSLLVITEKIGLVLEFIYSGLKKIFARNQSYVKTASPIIEEHNFDALLASSKAEEEEASEVMALKAVNKEQAVAKKDRTNILTKLTKAKIEGSELNLVPEKPSFTPSSRKRTFAAGLPNTGLLNEPAKQVEAISNETLEFVSMSIENKLSEFGVEAKIINAESGPVITRYELLPSRGVRGEKIVALGKEIARGLALTNVRIVETIPGKNFMGIEVPNFKRQVIYLKEIFDAPVYQHSSSKLTLALGKDIAGEVIVADLAKMPHLLVAGTTGSGKSVAVNAMILSILFQATPEEVKFIMIDPKMVELSFYQDIPHLLAPVVTDMAQAANALKWTVGEMERRYKIMARIGSKNIASYNEKVATALEQGRPIANPLSLTPEDAEDLTKWPYIVVIIDELADLM